MIDLPVILKCALAPNSGPWLPPMEDWVEDACNDQINNRISCCRYRQNNIALLTRLLPLLFILITNCVVSGMVFSTTEVCLRTCGAVNGFREAIQF